MDPLISSPSPIVRQLNPLNHLTATASIKKASIAPLDDTRLIQTLIINRHTYPHAINPPDDNLHLSLWQYIGNPLPDRQASYVDS